MHTQTTIVSGALRAPTIGSTKLWNTTAIRAGRLTTPAMSSAKNASAAGKPTTVGGTRINDAGTISRTGTITTMTVPGIEIEIGTATTIIVKHAPSHWRMWGGEKSSPFMGSKVSLRQETDATGWAE